jgi:transposase
MRRVSMKQIKEVLKLKYQMDFSFRRISKSVGISASTALGYCKRFEILPNKLEEFILLDEDVMYKMLFPEQTISHKHSSRPKPDVKYIDKEIRKKGVTYLLLWQEYKEQHPDGYGYTQFKTYYHKYRKKLNPSMRQIHLNGEKLFVDYSGVTVPIYDSKTGEINKAQIFVAVLGASGYTYVDATPSQKQEYFIKSHTKAFEFFNGVPQILVPDNLKSAVIKNNRDAIVLNESYKSMANHYGCVIEPARPYKPKDKSKAEQGVLAIQRWILAVLRHRKFFSVDELNIAIAPLLDRYNLKIMKRLNESRETLFKELDEPYLKQLPANRYIYKEFKIATVDIDYHITLHKARYSVPFKFLKQKVEIRYSTSTVEIYHKSKLISTHPRYYDSGYSTIKEHMPLNHQYQEEKFNPGRFLSWAQSIGVNSVEFTKRKLESEQYPSRAYRKLSAILSLTKQYEKYEVDLALGYAMSINATTVVSIKSILSKKLYYKKAANNIINKALNNHENIRGNHEYK